MRTNLFVIICFISNFIFSQGTSNLIATNINTTKHSLSYNNNSAVTNNIGPNGFEFEVLDAGVNTKFSEIGTGFFRNKLIMVSSKKLGGFAKIDYSTNEAYKELFCLDISANGALSRPLLFSRMLNTNDSEDQLTFSPDQKTVYFTRSSRENSLEYKLYKATLEEGSHGNWINEELLNINKNNASIETPFLNRTGDKLYFSSNMPGSIGGYDIYVSNVKVDGTLDTPKNLGHSINTTSDEKYPSLSIDGKHLYFSSKGHQNIGGYDLFVSRILSNKYKAPRNLGNTINTNYDEIAYFLATKNKGYVSSNKPNGKGSFDIYTVVNDEIIQSLEGKAIDLVTKIKLPNTLVILKDEDNNEVARQMTNESGFFSFDNVIPFEQYTLITQKDGFKDGTFVFLANKNFDTTYNKDLELNTTEPVIAKVDEELRIVLENIYFDFAKYSIKEESTISLNKIIKVLNHKQDIKLAINAHTDIRGKNSYNLKLSNKRAKSALNYLIKNGINKNRLTSKGFGETKPLIDCKYYPCTDKEHQSNRRIEFVILD
ncbi:OmpA family protein [Sabulilitoribacter arenilitoris]|uniref:OmpA family protein n=1 Tax=Wocania arenilitoris TaxID=2044858 RepID=A0AAE3JPE4_9FLAO|nr:OmpA family protein [Wocania arenilitoris]MCF7569616.1 OmpA family protein [Wocania arenilitoris]